MSDRVADDVFADDQKGPLTVLVYGLPLVVRIAQAVDIPVPPPVRLPDLMARAGEPAPAIAVSRAEYDAAMAALTGVLVLQAGLDAEQAWRRFALIRSAYEPALRALAGVTLAAPAPWTTDRPAVVGKPRFLRRRALRVDWSRRAPLPHPALALYRWLNPPDSSLVIDTVTGWRSKCAIDDCRSSSRMPDRSRLTPWRTRIRCTEMSATEPVNG